MNNVKLILCNSHGDPDCGDWETVDEVEIPEDVYHSRDHDKVAQWVSENTDLIGTDCMFCAVFDWND